MYSSRSILVIATILMIAVVSLAACGPEAAGPGTSAAPGAVPTGIAPAPGLATGVAPIPSGVAPAPLANATGAPTTGAAAGASGPVTIDLGPGRDASQTGKVTLTSQGDKTQVVIEVQPGPAGTPQPAHIHVGSCPGVGAVKYPLTSVVDGKSTTVVDASLNDLLSGGYSINVHKSTAEANVYVACADLKAAGR